jgi:EAL domain-containing protein (putative c-di-GMP-specific phosphodiesterase class I)
LPPFRLAVNLSNRQLKDPGFVDMLRGVLRETGFPPHDLEFEITESATVHDYFAVNEMLRAVGEMGVALSVDDFGTGYSSLSQLKQLPIDRVKIDRSFVDGVPQDEGDFAMVGAIVAMARQLGLSTTAEGVETQAQFDYLRGIGCEEMQGFLLAQPLESDALLQALETTADGLRLRATVNASA